jgi:hypothetical protein
LEKQNKFQIKQNKQTKKVGLNSNTTKENKSEKPITEWFFMTTDSVDARMISELLKSKGCGQIELWEAMNILQIELADRTIDFESVDYEFKSPSDAAFIKNRNIKTIFAVTVEEGAFDAFKPVLKTILEVWSGFLCADSDDFKPVFELKDLLG